MTSHAQTAQEPVCLVGRTQDTLASSNTTCTSIAIVCFHHSIRYSVGVTVNPPLESDLFRVFPTLSRGPKDI